MFFLAFYTLLGLGSFLSLFPGGFDFLWKHWINAYLVAEASGSLSPQLKG